MVYLRKYHIATLATLAFAAWKTVVVPVLASSAIFKEKIKKINKWNRTAPKIPYKVSGFLHPRPLVGRLEFLPSNAGGSIVS